MPPVALENPHRTQPCAAPQRFSVNVGTGILRDYLIEPYRLHGPLEGSTYPIFLQQVLLELPDAADVPNRCAAPCDASMTGSFTLRNSLRN
ncbi:hypothetical protein TNCV_220861 [Trichonephila clavipes]|nr:hypothetical protein TNCV_220861 [Trichonephila clavipes]